MALLHGTSANLVQLQQDPSASASTSYPDFDGWRAQTATSISATSKQMVVFQEFTPKRLLAQEESIPCLLAKQYEMLQSGKADTTISVDNMHRQFHSFGSKCSVQIQLQSVMPMGPPYIQALSQQDIRSDLMLRQRPSTELRHCIQLEMALPNVPSMGNTNWELDNTQIGSIPVLKEIYPHSENSAVSLVSCYPLSMEREGNGKSKAEGRKSRIPGEHSIEEGKFHESNLIGFNSLVSKCESGKKGREKDEPGSRQGKQKPGKGFPMEMQDFL